jgi:hypothetical protein
VIENTTYNVTVHTYNVTVHTYTVTVHTYTVTVHTYTVTISHYILGQWLYTTKISAVNAIWLLLTEQG